MSRIIAGTHKGRRLHAVPTDATRPTSDRVKESLFSRLEGYDALIDAVVAAATATGRDGFGPQGIAVALRRASRGSQARPRRLNPAEERLLRVQALKDNPDPRVVQALAEHDGVAPPAQATGTDGPVVDAERVELRALPGGGDQC